MKIVTLFGAGTSFGSGDVLDLRSNAKVTVPLGGSLFNELHKRYGYWQNIPIHLTAIFQRNFEEGMYEFREYCINSNDLKLADNFHQCTRDMAHFFLQFILGPKNIYLDYARRISVLNAKFITCTLNYDVLIEQAFFSVFGGCCYDVGGPKLNNILLKLHGSCNFFPDMGNLGSPFIKSHLAVRSLIYSHYRPLDVFSAIAELKKGSQTQNHAIVPAMALYMPGKPTLHATSGIEEIQMMYHAEVATADQIHIVGAAYSQDPHIWDAIFGSRAEIHYLNVSESDLKKFESAANKAGKRVYTEKKYFHEYVELLVHT